MKRLSLMLAVAVGLSAQARAPLTAKQQEREALTQALVSLIETSPLKTARVSIQVRSLDDGQIVFSQDGEELLNPASNVKLYTSAAALAKLGVDFRFDTEFLTDADFKQGKARVLYVRGKGDPTITTERLYGMVGDLLHVGLKEVQDLVLDDSYFDEERNPPGWDQEYGDRAYLAPTGALSLNWNTVGVFLRPGDTAGSAGVVELEPPSDFFVVDARLTTGTRLQRRYTVSSSPDRDRVRQKVEISGVVPVDKGTWSVWKRIDQPALYFGYTLKQLLQQRGIKVRGRIRAGPVPPNAKALAVAQSDTLDIVLKRLNKFSSNFVAEQLIKTLGAEGRGVPGSTANGIDVVEEFLAREVGLPRGSYVMKNGSGLNDTNRFSAAQNNRLLAHMYQRFPLAPEYLSALGIAGKDGTVKYRFEGTDAVGRLRAKTGTLENVSALSGYVQAVGGERFVFSVIVNDFPGRASTVVQHIDAVGAAVAAQGSVGGPSAAVASLTSPPFVVGPFEDLKARLKTYAAFSQRPDKKNAPFLRTAWRSEKDPAVRALIADALYQSDPREPSNTRILLDSALASDDVYGRNRRAAAAAGFDVPVVSSLVELAAGGNQDAVGRLLEHVRASAGEEAASALLAEQLAVVASDAPTELLLGLRSAAPADRAAALDAVVAGMAAARHVGTPFWDALREARGSLDPTMAAFALELDEALSQKIAQARAPEVEAAPPVAPAPRPARPGAAVPGG